MHEAEFGALFARFPQAGLPTTASPNELSACVRIPKSPSALAEISAIYQLAAKSMYQPRQTRGGEQGYVRLKRNLSIPRILIFDSKVWRGSPSFVAAPLGPPIRPADSDNALSIIS